MSAANDRCPGITLAQLEADMILKGFPASADFKDTLALGIATGRIKRCSRHPNHFLMTREGRKQLRKTS